MATTASSSHVTTLTPPSSSHGVRNSWDLAVPIQDEDRVHAKLRSKEDVAEDTSRLFSNRIGTSRTPVSKVDSGEGAGNKKYTKAGDQSYLVPNRINQLARKHSDTSGTGSEPDSLLDLYKNMDGRTNSNGHGDTNKSGRNPQWGQDQLDDSNWIHRDKLAQIESKELEEAGLRPRNISRASSKRVREQSIDKKTAIVSTDDQFEKVLPPWQEKKSQMAQSIPDVGESSEEPQNNWDLRSPEEITADRELETSHAKTHGGRPSTSRIPVAKLNSTPAYSAPSEFKKTRSRVGSSASTSENAIHGKVRTRSASVGSQVLLDDAEEADVSATAQSAPNLSPPGSPPKPKPTPKASPGTRKPSSNRANAQPKPRTSSTSSPAKRPGTSSGPSRPPTARPEGEAPWIATMYKPDPSLPPDQQIIPTHAKRLQQEQWEKEGKTGSVYDRDFGLLNTDEFPKPEEKPPEPERVEISENASERQVEQWPLSSPPIVRSESSGAEHGGYKTMPTINSSQAPSRSTPTPLPATSPKPRESIRVEVPPESTKEKKRCCCTIM